MEKSWFIMIESELTEQIIRLSPTHNIFSFFSSLCLRDKKLLLAPHIQVRNFYGSVAN